MRIQSVKGEHGEENVREREELPLQIASFQFSHILLSFFENELARSDLFQTGRLLCQMYNFLAKNIHIREPKI
jgi:hypothetical protein